MASRNYLTSSCCKSLVYKTSSMSVQAHRRNNEIFRAVRSSLSQRPYSFTNTRVFTSGRVVLNGRSLAVNADFAQQAIFLAQQLKCSEKYVASILHSIMAQNPNIDSVTTMEATVVEFHKRRRHLVDCLRFLFEAAESAQLPDAPRLYVRLETFLRQELVPTVKVDGKGGSLAYRIFKEIESLGNVVFEASAARQSATSNTVPPSSCELYCFYYPVLPLPSYRCAV